MAPSPRSSTRASAWSRISRLLSSTAPPSPPEPRARGRHARKPPDRVRDRSAPAAGRAAPAGGATTGADGAVDVRPGPAAQVGLAGAALRGDLDDRLPTRLELLVLSTELRV